MIDMLGNGKNLQLIHLNFNSSKLRHLREYFMMNFAIHSDFCSPSMYKQDLPEYNLKAGNKKRLPVMEAFLPLFDCR
ncbi:MAG: hypothetical protein EA360_04755 [Balneolaceae bacterium]|nr:MAG: hypothetical protein EA360_04755 [Balneolaceae bacterium]